MMHKFKKYAALFMALCMTVGSAAFAVSCDDSANSSTGSETSESSEETTEKFILTVTVQTEDGTGMEGIKFRLKRKSKRIEATTDANGVATFEAAAGTYELTYVEGNPLYHSGDWTTVTHEVELTENKQLTFVLIDESPNGSAERPFNLLINEDGTTDATVLPANTTYHYTLYRTIADNLIFESTSLKVEKEGTVYSPIDGVIVMPVELNDTYDYITFTLTNTSNEEITVTGYTTSSAAQGSLFNPFALTFDTEITAERLDTETENETVHYKWKATASGTLTVTSQTANTNIVLENNSASIVSDDWTLTNVTEGDTIYIIVYLEEVESLSFTAHFE